MPTTRYGTVTTTEPVTVTLDGESLAVAASPINLGQALGVGDRVACEFRDKSLVILGSPVNGARDLFMSNARAVFAGGGLRKGTTTGVSWSNRFQVSGAGNNAFALSGYFNIYQPADGTVIEVYKSDTGATATVSGGIVPLSTWQSLWYELPLGNTASAVGTFHIVYFATVSTIPPTWIPIVWRNADNNAYRWGDGLETTIWTYPTLGSGWLNYGSGYTSARYKRENGIVYVEGLVKSGTVSTSVPVFTLPAGSRPDGMLLFVNGSAGGLADLRVSTSGGVLIYALYSGTNSSVSLTLSFAPDQ